VGAHGVTFTLRGLEASRARVQALRVEVFDLSGRGIWASGWRPGTRLSWRFAAPPASVPANGLYVYVVTVKRADGRLLRLPPQKLLLMR